VRQLGQRSWVDFDGLGEVKRDPFALRQQHLLDDLKVQRMRRQPLDPRLARQQRAAALRLPVVEDRIEIDQFDDDDTVYLIGSMTPDRMTSLRLTSQAFERLFGHCRLSRA
jgi:hypothetical protein